VSLEKWLDSSGNERGYVATAQTMFDLSRDWYEGRMSEEWEPPTARDAESIFTQHGLIGDFWKLT
jgi:hypothetical protein